GRAKAFLAAGMSPLPAGPFSFKKIHHGGTETRRRSGHLTIGSSGHRNSLLFSDHPITRSPDHPILGASVSLWWISQTAPPPRYNQTFCNLLVEALAMAPSDIPALRDVFHQLKTRMDKAVEDFRTNLAAARTGRASVHMLDTVRVPYYGSEMPLNQLSQV